MSRKNQEKLEQLTESVDEGRRSIVKRLLTGGALLAAAPAITSLVAPGEAYADDCGKGKGKGGKGKGKGKGSCPLP